MAETAELLKHLTGAGHKASLRNLQSTLTGAD